MAKVTGLSGNEIYCLALKQYSAGELVVGNSVNSMDFLGSLGAGLTNVLGGEVPQVTQAIHEGRAAALARLTEEASRQGASGGAGVTGELRSFSGSTEFLFVGSCVHSKSPSEGLFTSAGDAQELFCRHRQVNALRSGERLFSCHADCPRPCLPPPSLPTGGDQSCGLAVFPVPAEPAYGRGDACGTRDLRDLRDRAAMGEEIRQELRRPNPPAGSGSRRQMAFG